MNQTFYVHEIAIIDLLKIYFLKNTKTTYKPNNCDLNCNWKMNEIVNKFLLVGDKFLPEMHLKQPGFTYSACGPFAKNK